MTKKIKVQIPKLYIDVLNTFGIQDISEQNKKNHSFINILELLAKSGRVIVLEDDSRESIDES